MRFADALARALLCTGLCSMAACSSLGQPLTAVKEAGAALQASVAAALPGSPASAPQPEATASAVAARKIDVRPPVDAAEQRAFDEARRALRAGRSEEAERGFRALAQANPELGGAHANLG